LRSYSEGAVAFDVAHKASTLYGALDGAGILNAPRAVVLTRRDLGVSESQLLVVLTILTYRKGGEWASMSQEVIADDACLGRQAVNRAVRDLRSRGLLATRVDPFHGPVRQRTFHYCLDPYLAACDVALSKRRGDPRDLLDEAAGRVEAFVHEVEEGRWTWQVGDISSDRSQVGELRERFENWLAFLSRPTTQVAN
jgi:hypothetical protein